eukprot:CAMPEP_0114550550 /NCGR_PEP_ID=MMETSP0114-20121206/6132_1 /TAXON_ID=31324 /ORGANISM="Goniomonas sp, Strain m" /LENGTH=83 /DNA_ID=CAMNT_0001735329 /DNA_START=334 /DNA_END=583 /DNA_ORIENTATION=+
MRDTQINTKHLFSAAAGALRFFVAEPAPAEKDPSPGRGKVLGVDTIDPDRAGVATDVAVETAGTDSGMSDSLLGGGAGGLSHV